VVLHAIGETATITFGAFDWNEQPVDLSSGIRLVSSAPDVVEVAGDKVIARRSGISTITVSSAASQNGLSSITVQVILPPAQPVGISLLPERLSLSGPGDQVGLSTLLRFDDGSERHIESQTTFTSSAPGVIAITSPWAVAKAGGTSTITAHYGGMSSQVVMQVGSAPSPTSLSIRLGKVSMIPGGSTGFEVVATWADGHQTSVTDLVSVDTTNHAIATVSGSTLYGVLAGQTNLVVNWLGMTTSAAVVVTAAPLAQLSRTDAIIANHGDDQVLGSHIGQAIPLDYLMRAGGTELHLGAFTASGLVGCTVAITQPLAVVPPGQAGSLRVAITPLANAWSCSISGITNDPLRNPYQWTIGGMAAPVPGNLDGSLDGKVTFEDLALFLSSYGKVTTDAGYLIGADLVTSGSSAGRVDFDDLSAFLALYATAP
jgi:hypothetical protein